MDSLRIFGVPLFFFGLVFAAAGCGSDPSGKVNELAPKGTGFITRSVNNGHEERKYTVFLPYNYTATKRWPTIVFLHGIGEAGNDGHKCLTEGLGPHIAKHPESFPFVVIFPQSSGDWGGDQPAATVAASIDDAEKDYAIDKDRIILTGLSTGGEGTWRIGAKYANRFAALVPMCGWGDGDDVPTLAHVPVWIFHNSGDPFVFAASSGSMYKKLKEAGGDVQYTEYGEFGHNCWDKAYDDGKLFDWMLQQRRK